MQSIQVTDIQLDQKVVFIWMSLIRSESTFVCSIIVDIAGGKL